MGKTDNGPLLHVACQELKPYLNVRQRIFEITSCTGDIAGQFPLAWPYYKPKINIF